MTYSPIDIISTIHKELERSSLIRVTWHIPSGVAFSTLKGGAYRLRYQVGCPGIYVGYYNPTSKEYTRVLAPNGMKYWIHEEIVMMFMTTVGDIWAKQDDPFYMAKAREFVLKAGTPYEEVV